VYIFNSQTIIINIPHKL